MLILSRRRGEIIRINDDISITILQIHKGQVRVGITAPKEVCVLREEIYIREKAVTLNQEEPGNGNDDQS